MPAGMVEEMEMCDSGHLSNLHEAAETVVLTAQHSAWVGSNRRNKWE